MIDRLRSRPVRWVLTVLSLVVMVLVMAWKSQAIAERGALNNWDLVGYVACAVSFEEHDPVEVHRRTYDALKAEFPPDTWTATIEHGHYRRKTFEKAAVLADQKTFYCQRVLYTGLTYGLHKTGMGLVASTTTIAVISFFLTGLLLWLWVSHHLPPLVALPVAAGVALNFPIVYTARNGTPDALCALLVLAAMYALLHWRQLVPALILLLLAVLARGDTLIFAVLTAGLMALSKRWRTWPSLALLGSFVVVTSGVYFGLNAWSGNRGWWALFQFSLVQRTPYLDRLDTVFSWDVYWTAITERFGQLWGEALFFHIGLAPLAAWALAQGSRPRSLNPEAAVAIACFVTLVVRYALFPSIYVRLYLPYFLVVEMLLVMAIAARIPRRNADPPGATVAEPGA